MRVNKICQISNPASNLVKKVVEASHTGAVRANRVSAKNHLNTFDRLAIKCYSVGKSIFDAVPGGTFAKTGVVVGFFTPLPCAFLAGFAIGSGIDYVKDKIKTKHKSKSS